MTKDTQLRDVASALRIDWLKIVLLLSVMLITYGKLTQKIDDLQDQVQRLEVRINQIWERK